MRFHEKNFWEAEFVKTGTGKNRGFPEHCAMCQISVILMSWVGFVYNSIFILLAQPNISALACLVDSGPSFDTPGTLGTPGAHQ